MAHCADWRPNTLQRTLNQWHTVLTTEHRSAHLKPVAQYANDRTPLSVRWAGGTLCWRPNTAQRTLSRWHTVLTTEHRSAYVEQDKIWKAVWTHYFKNRLNFEKLYELLFNVKYCWNKVFKQNVRSYLIYAEHGSVVTTVWPHHKPVLSTI